MSGPLFGRISRTGPVTRGLSSSPESGGRDRTDVLRVMGPARSHCATPLAGSVSRRAGAAVLEVPWLAESRHRLRVSLILAEGVLRKRLSARDAPRRPASAAERAVAEAGAVAVH